MTPRDTALNRIRLRHLQCFLAVARAGNLRRAAELLAITQPAVTKTLNELEEILGVRLFERGRRGASPTPEAEAFMRHAQASVASLGQAVDSVLPGHDETPLRIGALPTLAPSLLAATLKALHAERPTAVVQVITARNRELLAALRERQLDVVVGRPSEPDAMVGLTFELLFAQPLVIVARRGHRLASGAPTPAAIGTQALVLAPSGTAIRHAVDSFFASHGIAPRRGVTETLSVSLARALVDDGALWFTPLSAVEPGLADGGLVRLALSVPTEEAIGVLLRTDGMPSATLAAFLAALRTQGAQRRRTLQARRRRVAKPMASKPALSKA